MDDRLIPTERSVVSDEDCTGYAWALVWIYPSACHGMSLSTEHIISTHDGAQAVVYALYDLCRHQEYIESLRLEIASKSTESNTGDPYEKMLLLDSFLKESARFSPSDTSTIMPIPVSQ